MPLIGQRREGWWNEKHDLSTLITKFSNSECTDPRDSVYALLGICSDVEVTIILRPDHEIAPELVFRNTLSYLIFSEIVGPETYELSDKAIWFQNPKCLDSLHVATTVLD